MNTIRSPQSGKVAYGYDEKTISWVTPCLSNLHTHFRGVNDSRFPIAVAECAKLYDYATAMPNLGKKDLIRTPEGAIAYREAILQEAHKTNELFDVNVPLYLEPDTRPETVFDGFHQKAWIAAKLYPKGGTTQSDEGVDFRQLLELMPVFRMMENLGMVLLIHAEPVFADDGSEIDAWDRERESLNYIREIIVRFPSLHIVFEHISSQAGADFVRYRKAEGARIEATIAPQYLVWNRTQLVRGGMNPAYFSIPVLKHERDRQALIDFMLDGHGFLGTDSAPHTVPSKSKPCGCAGGVFNEPVGPYIYFRIFKEEGSRRGIIDWFDRFVKFACITGPHFYGVPMPSGPTRRIRYKKWKVPDTYGEGANAIIPMLAGETVHFELTSFS